MKIENCQIHEQASQDLFSWMKGHLTDTHGLGGVSRGTKRPQDPTMYGQICGSMCLMQRNGKRSKSGRSRNQNSIMPDDYVVSSSLNQMMKNLNTPWKTLAESLKFRCQQQCLVKHPTNEMRKRSEGVPQRYHEDHISAKGINSLSRYNLVHKFVVMPQASKKPDAKAAAVEKYRHGSWRKSETKKKLSMKQGIKAEKFILRHWWISVIWKIRCSNLNFKK